MMMMSKPPPRYTIPNEETLGLLHVRQLVKTGPQEHLSLEETLGLLHNEDVVEVLLQGHNSQEETLGLLHTVNVVEVPIPSKLSHRRDFRPPPHRRCCRKSHSLEVDVDLGSTSMVKNTNPLIGEMMEDEGEENH